MLENCPAFCGNPKEEDAINPGEGLTPKPAPANAVSNMEAGGLNPISSPPSTGMVLRSMENNVSQNNVIFVKNNVKKFNSLDNFWSAGTSYNTLDSHMYVRPPARPPATKIPSSSVPSFSSPP